MENIRKTATVATYFTHLVFSIARLGARRDVEDLAAGLAALLERGKAVRNAEEDAQAFAICSLAARVESENVLGDRLEEVGFTAFVQSGRDYGAEPYTTIFRNAPSRVADLPWVERVPELERIRGDLLKAGAPLDAHVEPLTGEQAAVQAAVVALGAADGRHGTARDTVDVWKDEVNDERRRVFGELTKRMPRARKRVRSYFRSRRPGKRGGAAARAAKPTAPSTPTSV